MVAPKSFGLLKEEEILKKYYRNTQKENSYNTCLKKIGIK